MNLVVDTSAIIAILLREPEREEFEAALLASEPAISAGTLVETLRVVHATVGPHLLEPVHDFLATYGIEIVPVDREQVRLAQDGLTRFGKGRRAAPAVLNFGDLFAYALARQLSAPLLYKGNDFGVTDVISAAPQPEE